MTDHITDVEVVQGPGLIRPVASTKDIVNLMNEYQELCEKILTPDDVQGIGNKSFKKKSAWRKLALAFGVSLELVREDIVRDEAGAVVRATFLHRATAANGRSSTGWGSCSASERGFNKPDHDIPAVAETRSKNRALSDLFGLGEVSAEEVVGDHGSTGTTTPSYQVPQGSGPLAGVVADLTTRKGVLREFYNGLNELGDEPPFDKGPVGKVKMRVMKETFNTQSFDKLRGSKKDGSPLAGDFPSDQEIIQNFEKNFASALLKAKESLERGERHEEIKQEVASQSSDELPF